MSLDQDLAKLVKEAVKRELSSGRMRTNEIISGGDVTVASMGNIYLRPGVNGRAYYKDVEIGSGGGSGTIDGSGTAGYIPKFSDADTLANSLLSESGTTMSINGSLDINKSGGIGTLYFYNTGVVKGKIYPFTGASVNDFLIDANGGSLYLSALTDVRIDVPLSMESQKITGLAAGTTNGDAVRYEQVLLLTGGTLTGNLSIAKANPLLTIKATGASSPILDFRDSSDNVDAQLYTTTGNDTVLVSTYGGLYLATALTTGGSIYLETKDVTRLTIADALITSDVPITMSTTNAINFSDTNTKIVRSGSNLDIHAGGAWKIGVTSTYVDFSVAITPSVTDSKDIGTSSYYWNNAYIKTLYIDDASTKIDNNTGNMRLTVATGKVFEFVVSPA